MKESIDNSSRTIPLVKSIRYTSYQFYARSEPAGGITSEELFKKEILYILNWVKKRCRYEDLPSPMIDIPAPEDFKTYSLDKLQAFRHDIGYKLEVIITEDKKTWAMQITEPDRGPYPDNPELNREVVPGRLFETDIGLKIKDKYVDIATRTYIYEPIGTKLECDAFRQAFIKEFIKDNCIKLEYEWPIKTEPFDIKNKDYIENLAKWITSAQRQSLAVIHLQKPESENIDKEKEKEKDNEDNEIEKEKKKESLPDLQEIVKAFNKLAYSLRAYAFFFFIPHAKRHMLLQLISKNSNLTDTDSDYDNNDLFIIDGNKYKDAKTDTYNIADLLSDINVKNSVYKRIKKYYEKKDVDFNGVEFVPDLRKNSLMEFLKTKRSKEELLRQLESSNNDYEYLKKSFNAEKENLVAEHSQKLTAKDEEIRKYKEKLDENREYIKEIETEFEECEEKIKYISKRIQFLRNRPKKFKDIPQWVEKYFLNRLTLCKRACDEIEKIKNEYDFDFICDAIEHLALDYYKQLCGEITEDIRNDTCSKVYNSYIEITKVNPPKITNTKDYEFTYNKKDGSIMKAEIDRHLYLGSEGRIYFIFDKEDKRIVIASLPKHLNID